MNSLVEIIKGNIFIKKRIKNIFCNFLNNYSCSELNKIKIIEFLIEIKCIRKQKRNKNNLFLL